MAEYTQSMLDALTAAIATGTKEVWYGDKKVIYRTLDEMIRIQKLMKDSLGLNSSGPKRFFTNFNKGLI